MSLFLLSISFACFAIHNGQDFLPPPQGLLAPVNCPQNEEYCYSGNCPGTICQDLWSDRPRKKCLKDCISEECICSFGFYRKGEPERPFAGPCITKAECKVEKKKAEDLLPKTNCPKNEVYSKCYGNDCPGKTCQDLWLIPPRRMCLKKDCNHGCICDLGFYRKGEPDRPFAGPCITMAACVAEMMKGNPPTQMCGLNEEWNTCHSGTCPGAACADLRSDSPKPACTDDCQQGCICAPGFYRKGKPGNPYARPCVTRSECLNGGKASFEISIKVKFPSWMKENKK